MPELPTPVSPRFPEQPPQPCEHEPPKTPGQAACEAAEAPHDPDESGEERWEAVARAAIEAAAPGAWQKYRREEVTALKAGLARACAARDQAGADQLRMARALENIARGRTRDPAATAEAALMGAPEEAGERPGTAGEIARAFHDAYERLAPVHGYETREASAKPWDDVPEQNRQLMTATAAALLDAGVIAAARGTAYPHMSGDVIVLGPGVFAAADGSVLNWDGVNYAPQAGHGQAADALAAEVRADDAKSAEIGRLRAALEQVAGHHADENHPQLQTVAKTARRALGDPGTVSTPPEVTIRERRWNASVDVGGRFACGFIAADGGLVVLRDEDEFTRRADGDGFA